MARRAGTILAMIAITLAGSHVASARPLGAELCDATGPAGRLAPCGQSSGLERVIYGSAVLFQPPPTEVDRVLDTFRASGQARTATERAAYDETTTMNALALSRASGVPLRPRDVADRESAATLDANWRNFLTPHASTILNILTLGVRPVNATGFDVSYAGKLAARATESNTHDLPNETTLAGLALIGGGVDVDPRTLISSTGETTHRAGVSTFPRPSLPPEGADLAAQAAIAGIHGPPIPSVYAFSNRSIERAVMETTTRDVVLSPETALDGVALARNGIPFDVQDALNITQTRSLSEVDHHERHIERAVLLYWLTLGLHYEPTS